MQNEEDRDKSIYLALHRIDSKLNMLLDANQVPSKPSVGLFYFFVFGIPVMGASIFLGSPKPIDLTNLLLFVLCVLVWRGLYRQSPREHDEAMRIQEEIRDRKAKQLEAYRK